eukprot:scaffold310609_cov47-Attheya_sp.AAC.1
MAVHQLLKTEEMEKSGEMRYNCSLYPISLVVWSHAEYFLRYQRWMILRFCYRIYYGRRTHTVGALMEWLGRGNYFT